MGRELVMVPKEWEAPKCHCGEHYVLMSTEQKEAFFYEDDGPPVWYMMWQTVSDQPMSPSFETKDELARWLSENDEPSGARGDSSYGSWMSVINAGYIPSMAFIGGKLISGGELADELQKTKEEK